MAFLDSDFAQLPDIISQPKPQLGGADDGMQDYFGQPSPFAQLGEYLMNRPVFQRGARPDSPISAFQYQDVVGDSLNAMGGQQSAIQQQFDALMQRAQEERAAQEAERQALMDRISALEGRPQQPAIDLDALRSQIREEVIAGLQQPVIPPIADANLMDNFAGFTMGTPGQSSRSKVGRPTMAGTKPGQTVPNRQSGADLMRINDLVRDARQRDFIRNDPNRGRPTIMPVQAPDNRGLMTKLSEAIKAKGRPMRGSAAPQSMPSRERRPVPPPVRRTNPAMRRRSPSQSQRPVMQRNARATTRGGISSMPLPADVRNQLMRGRGIGGRM
jgi:hypothetical protein